MSKRTFLASAWPGSGIPGLSGAGPGSCLTRRARGGRGPSRWCPCMSCGEWDCSGAFGSIAVPCSDWHRFTGLAAALQRLGGADRPTAVPALVPTASGPRARPGCSDSEAEREKWFEVKMKSFAFRVEMSVRSVSVRVPLFQVTVMSVPFVVMVRSAKVAFVMRRSMWSVLSWKLVMMSASN